MKNAVLILADAFIAGIRFTLTPLNAQPAADGAASASQKWEYLLTYGDDLEKRGDQGWELVAVTEKVESDGGARQFYFSRKP